MKFSFFIFSMAASVAKASVVQGTKTFMPSSSTDLIESQVILHGVVGEPSPNDLTIVGQALVASYNDAHWELGHYMTGFDVPFQLPLSENALKQSCGGTCRDDDAAAYYKSGLFMSVVTPIKQSCGGTCRDDDADAANTILTKAIKQSCGGTCRDDDASAEKQVLQESFCQKIQSSGSSYLAGAQSCSIVFVPQKEMAPVVAPVANMEAHVILHGVLEAATDMDMAIIGKALVSSYNDVNWETGYHMSDVEIPFQLAIPETVGQSCGGTCRDDDDRKGNKGLFVTLTAPIQQSCGGTCRDDDATAAILKQSCGGTCRDDDSAARNMLEASFCDKIKSSISTNLSSANMCAIVLVAN